MQLIKVPKTGNGFGLVMGLPIAYDDVITVPSGSLGLVNPPYNLYQWLLANSIGKPVAAGDPLPGTVFTPPTTAKTLVSTISLFSDGTYTIK